jgi:hypothetical protein
VVGINSQISAVRAVSWGFLRHPDRRGAETSSRS